MAKFLVKASYTAEGAKGLLKDGGSKRQAVVQKVIEGLGGRIETFYFALGDADVVIVADLPDTVSAAALSVTVGAAGGARCSTTPLLSPAEMDLACKKKVGYKAPGA